MCGSKLASGACFLLFFQLQLLLWIRILLFWMSKTYHLEACCLHFTTLGTILSAWGHPGGPWEQQEGHVGVRSKIFSDLGLILGSHFESFLSSDELNSVFFWSLFPGHFLDRFFNGISDSWSSENKVFARKVLQKPCFRKNRLLVIRGSIFWCFLEALGAGFLSFSALETGLTIQCFSRSLWGP